MKRKIIKILRWLLPVVSMIVFLVKFNYSIESGHIVKKNITYDHGEIKQIIIYDSSFLYLDAREKIDGRLGSQYNFYHLLDSKRSIN